MAWREPARALIPGLYLYWNNLPCCYQRTWQKQHSSVRPRDGALRQCFQFGAQLLRQNKPARGAGLVHHGRRAAPGRRPAAALRIRTSYPVKRSRPSTGFWLILRARSRTPPLCHTWHHRPERHLRHGELMRSIKRRCPGVQGELMRSIKRGCPGVHCLFSQEADPQPRISKDATEKLVARTVAYSRSGMDGYELRDHLSQQRLRPIGGYFENFYRSVGSICEEIYSQPAVYSSYTPTAHMIWMRSSGRGRLPV